MSYVPPSDVIDRMVDGGVHKAVSPGPQVVVRAALAAMLLGAATTISGTAVTQTGVGLAGAIIFPLGFCIVILLGLELVTGSFALVPLAVWRGEATPRQMARSFGCAILGHMIGALAFAGCFWALVTEWGTVQDAPLAVWMAELAEHKTSYAALGTGAGLSLLLLKAVLCNWLVSLGVVMGMTSTSTGGKILAMWLPVTMFFGLGLEHAVVNLFVIPAGMFVGADVTLVDWWLWNEIPALVGNLVGAATLTALGMYLAHRPAAPWRQRGRVTAHTEPALHTEPAPRPEPVRPGPVHVQPVHVELLRTKPLRTKPLKTEPLERTEALERMEELDAGASEQPEPSLRH